MKFFLLFLLGAFIGSALVLIFQKPNKPDNHTNTREDLPYEDDSDDIDPLDH